MQPLAGLDAAFLALETPTSHLHITGVLVFDASTMPGGYSFEKMKRFVGGRTHLSPAFHRRLLKVPFNLGRPVWINDPDFDLDYHVRRAALPAPGGLDELSEFAAEIASRPLDRDRPLWEMWFVEGVEGGNAAMVAKMHHATIDGVSGANLMANLLDLEPKPVDDDVAPSDGWQPEPLPSDAELVGRAVVGRVRRRFQLVRNTGTIVRAVGELAGRRLRRDAPTMATPFTAPPTPFNQPLTAHRRMAFASVPLETVKQVKRAFGVTVNDVVLALCAGALRRYLQSHGELPDQPLIAAVPVSTRGDEAGGGETANMVSGMIVSLATEVADPVERLRRIAESSAGAKEEHEALGGDFVAELSELAGSQVFGLGARAYSALRLASRHRPALNLIVSNVPGPDFPLYFGGARLRALYPMGPIYDGMGLNVTVLSYLDQVGFGFVSCRELAPDLTRLADAVGESLQELEKEAGTTAPAATSPRPGTPRIPPLAEEERDDQARELLGGAGAPGSPASNIFSTLVRHPGLFRKWLPFGGKMLAGKLPPRDRELLILRTGYRCRSEYEWGQHTLVARGEGLSDDEIARVRQGADAPGWTDLEAALLRAADELHDDACISDATWAALAERYDERQLIEVPMLVGHYHMAAFVQNSLRFRLNPGREGLAAE